MSDRILEPRRAWIALLLSLLTVGLGHLYAGRGRRGAILFFLALAYVPAIQLLARMPAGDYVLYALLGVIAFEIGLAFFAVVDATFAALRAERPYHARAYNHVGLYIGLVLVSTLWTTMSVSYLRAHAFEAFRLPTRSMEPTLAFGDRVLVNKFRVEHLQLGDVVVFRAPENPDRTFIKRVIGMPGDRVRIDENGAVFLNDRPFSKPASGSSKKGAQRLREGTTDRIWYVHGGEQQAFEIDEVPAGHVYVLGDNRPQSMDSRRFGPVPLGDVTGVLQHIVSPNRGWRISTDD